METHEKVEIVKLASGPQKPVSEYKRFAILVLGSFGCIVCSFSYAWNLVSADMQERYHFTQRDMSTIVTVGLVVQYCVLPYAFLFDYLGPLPIVILATIYFPLGTLLLALCFMGKINGSVATLSVFNALMSCGCSLFDLGCCVTVLSYFPTNRGPVTALLKTFTGLGSALVACLYAGYFHSDPEKHFFFLFALALVVGVLCMVFLRLPEYHLTQYQLSHLPIEERQRRENTKAQYLRQKPPIWRFVYGFVILIVLIVFLPTQSALASYRHLDSSAKRAFAIVTTILTLLYLVVAAPVPFWDPKLEDPEEDSEDLDADANISLALKIDSGNNARKQHDTNEPHCERSEPAGNDDNIHKGNSTVTAEAMLEEDDLKEGELEIDYIAPAYPGSFIHNLRTLELWALWWTMFTVVGSEFVIIYNATNILAALQGEDPSSSLSTLLTVLNGVGSAVGRLLMSYFEVHTQKRKAEDRIPITISLFLPTGSIIISLILFLVLPAAALPLPYVVAALGNGFLAGVTLLVSRTIFAKDPAKHYNFCFTATMLASLVFNRFLYGEWYTVQAEKQNHANHRCYGKHCVLMPLVVLMALACTAFATDAVLHLRYRSFCQRTLAERARLHELAHHNHEMNEAINSLHSDTTPADADGEPRGEAVQSNSRP
ncbi:putative protein associated with differentiation 4 [Leptomonas pyrrhocoris]|uniref:Nodulin-like domain-containing protein n=1 Tax=Leptomonas pyrrhocoris TaxID=157538 RepID=A0A0M9FVL5_LEPPY|nr:putative protein associated with differentiation 4 [Leptomonas pyrrhocoris]XP_015655439.1 putative protein associated with differentiation 4 [Leptomonas pyrrhocoris]XP_015655440.1 putative protein associated with differentiation 4 [Leptomonas pyrrhocoris]XP_015655441.1 putative protein associated with differentiation 4 [Leptomonas pyrrhocoris]XP_015655442.1 putative protein associated with differentiation 4 [Leptomonas pyrrhocoris]XP_015655443.1 putative protein associated with differentiat|eukprot:XP_015655438.1 putative protein associated with differentiation 4 [Leptomonas pyrrhocoris]